MQMRDELLASPQSEVQLMIEREIVRQMRVLLARGWGAKRVAKELGIARNTVRRYQRGGVIAERQERREVTCETEPAIARAVLGSSIDDAGSHGDVIERWTGRVRHQGSSPVL